MKTRAMAPSARFAVSSERSDARRRGAVACALAFALFLFAPSARAIDVQSLPAPQGEVVWYAADHTLPMIAMTAALPAGSAYDPVAKPGLANFAADLLDEGAGQLKSDAFQTALSNRAIRLTVEPDRDYLIVSLVTLADNAKDAFQLLGLALARPRFDADAIARVRAQILAGLAHEDEEPSDVAAKAFFRTYFHEHPYAHAIGGDPRSVAGINAADLKRFAATHWVAQGLKVAVSGDFDRDTLSALLKSAFGSLPRGNLPPLPGIGRVGQPGVTVVSMPVPQPTAVFGLPGMLRSDPDFIPAYVANYIVGGGGFSSRLTNEVRVQRGLTYDVSTSFDAWRRAGFALGEVATRRGGMKETISVIRDTLRDFAANGPTDKELADAKTYLTGSFPLAFSSNTGIAAQLSTFQREGLDASYVQKRNALIDAVTVDDVKRAAKRVFDPARLTFVVAGSLAGENASSATPGRPVTSPASSAAKHR